MRLIVFILALLFVSAGMAAVTAHPDQVMAVKLYGFSEPKDTLKNVKSKLGKKLLDKIAANSRQREKNRVLVIIKEFLSSTPYLTEEDLSALKDTLDLKGKQNYAALLSLIQNQASKIDSLKKKEDIIEQEEASSQKGISEEDLNNLVNKLVPILTEKAEEEKAGEEKQKRIKKIRALLASGGTIRDTLILNDSVSKIYSLRVSRKAEVIGFNPYWVKERYPNYNFDLLSTLVFSAYELNCKTGAYVNLNGWENSKVVNAAKKAKCSVALGVFVTNSDEIPGFLKNSDAQETFVRTVTGLLEKRGTKAVHVIFENLANADKERFVRFIRNVSETLKEADPSYSLNISIPVRDEKDAYDVKALEPYVNKFVIDFTKKNEQLPGPIAPLEGAYNSIASGISFYLNKKVLPSKFIACMPYRGAMWSKAPREFIDYINYNEVKTTCKGNPVAYDVLSATARMDFINEGDTTEQLWFDDEKTLRKKYAYILDKGLGGAGIWALGYDDGFGEVWDVLMDKFVTVDTFDVKVVSFSRAKDNISFWDKVKREFHEYKMILANPCHKRPDDFKSDDYIIFVVLFFLILLIVVGVIYIYEVRNLGDSWKWRKAVLRLLIFLVIMVVVTTFLYFFLNKNIPLVGLTSDEGKACNPMPFSTLISITSVGFITGVLVMRFLITPLLKKDDIP